MRFYTKPGGFMEDRKQSRTPAAADKAARIFDLTEDMAIADQAKHKIFDLADGRPPRKNISRRSSRRRLPRRMPRVEQTQEPRQPPLRRRPRNRPPSPRI